MPYIKQNLKDGDTFTAEHLAHMESGIAEAMSKAENAAPKKGVDYFTQEDVQEIVRIVLEQSKTSKLGYVTLFADKWIGDNSQFSQVVEVEGVTANSQVDLTLSADQVEIFLEKKIAFVTGNKGGIVTVYAIGQKPVNDYTIQVTITEVAK